MDQREKERLLWNLKSTPNELADLVGDLDTEALRWRPVPDKWSILELLCHLRDMEQLVLQSRCKQVLSGDNPYLPEVKQNEVAEAGNYQAQDPGEVLGTFQTLRDETVAMLQDLPVEGWQRGGIHFSSGPITIEEMVVRMSNHDASHLNQMKDIARLKMPW
jgi:hypothetical protein